MGPFDRFNDRAKRVLALAQDEAIRFNHNYIGPEHLLLGLVREGEGVAARVLDSLGVQLSKVRVAAEFLLGRGDATTSPSEVVLHPRTKKVIELAKEEAEELGHRHIGTEHLLLGLIRESEGNATGVLQSLGVSLETVRHQVIATLGQPSAAERAAGGTAARRPGGPFDRFDDSAKRVLALAQDEAIRFNHNYIGTEHLLLGLIREGQGVAARVLQTLGVELSKVRTAVEFIVGRSGSETPPSEITLSPRTKKIIELAIDEARRLGHGHVGTEHLLLGIVREGEGIASGVLQSLGVTLEQVRHAVIAELGRPGPTSSGVHIERAADPRGSLTDAQGKKRDWYCEDVLSGKLKVHVIYQDELVLAIEHPYPDYVAHAVVIPKKHVEGLMAEDAADPELLRAMIRAVQAVARSVGLHEQGFRIEANAAAPGVTPHMHWHVIGPGLPPPRRSQRGAAVTRMTITPAGPAGWTPTPGGPFDALSDRAKRVLALSQDEAQRLWHGHLGTEHLLAALVRDSDSPPAKALAEAGVLLSAARDGAERAVPRGDKEPSRSTLTPRMKKILELAKRLAGEGRPVGRGHLLMALIDDGGGVAVGVLRELGVDLARLRARTLELMRQ